MIHQFDTDIAIEVGILPAVLFANIQHWITKNEANQKHFHDGRYWTYNSMKAFQKQFPYVSCRQIDTALKKLIDADLIVTGNYNAMQRDRTLWYALTDKAISILQNGEMHFTKNVNPFHQNVKPLPDNKPNNKQQILIDNMSSDDDTPEKKQLEKIDYKQIAKDFNQICKGLPQLQALSDKRKRKIKSLIFALEESELIKNMTYIEVLQSLFQLVQDSDFLTGRSGKWRTSFDWIIESSNAIKVLEGNYSNKETKAQLQKNQFNAFPQREYSQMDYASMEKQLLNKS